MWTPRQGRIIKILNGKRKGDPGARVTLFDPFLVATGEIMEGEFPAKAKAMVKEFILLYRKELEEMWEKGEYSKLPPLK